MQSLPSATYTELDQSTVPPSQLADYHGLITPTLFGPSDKPYLITTVDQFNAQFGGSGVASPFYPQIKRALARGTAFYVQRLVASAATAASAALGTSQVTINAEWVGSYANGNLSVQYKPLGTDTFCSLTVSYTPNKLLNEVWTAATYTALIALVNAQSNLINITVGSSPTEPTSSVGSPVYLATGTDGSFTTGTRTTAVNTLFQNFNNILNIATIGSLGCYQPTDAANVLAYAAGRGDVMALFELDPSLSYAAAITAAGTLALPIGSSFIAVYWGGYIRAWSPDDGALTNQSLLTDIMSVYSYCDTQAGNQYRAPAGSTRGLLSNVSGFACNMLSPALGSFANQLVQAGVNIVGQHPSFGPVVWGAQTMNQKGSALDAINVRRMMIWLHQQLKPIYDGELFDPMDPQSWLHAYNQAKPILKSLVADQAISQWTYTGDQNASSIGAAVYNSPLDLANGLYKALINVIPIGYISGISFTAEVNNLLSLFQTAD